MQTDSIPSDQKFSCKWNLSFYKVVPLNRLSFYLGSWLHIISSLFSHFCLLQNVILHEMLKLEFWKFKLIFLRMQFYWLQLFVSSFGYQFELIFLSYKKLPDTSYMTRWKPNGLSKHLKGRQVIWAKVSVQS